MKQINILILLFLLALLTSCTKDDDITIDANSYLIFGHFYGECLGEGCVETFKLTDTKLFEDTNDNYSGTGDFNFVELSNDQFDLVKNLPDFFPSNLLNENDKTFGCPDCADQGGIFIQYVKGNSIKSWRIDQSKGQVPSYLHSFMDQINEKIGLINN